MKFIFSSGSLYTYSVARCFDFAAQAGFEGIELMVDQRWDTRQPAFLRGLMAQYEQPILAVHSPFVPQVPGWPADEIGRIKETVKLAEAVGAQVVVHHLPWRIGWVWVQVGRVGVPVPWPHNSHRAYQRWLESGYLTLQAQTKVRLCIENMPARRWLGLRFNPCHWNSVAEIARFSALTLDTTHLGTWGLDPNQVYAQLRGRVQHIHLSNFDGWEHRLPEQGHLRLDRLLATLPTSGYEGVITLELHPDSLKAGEADERIIALLKTSLGHCRAWVEAKT